MNYRSFVPAALLLAAPMASHAQVIDVTEIVRDGDAVPDPINQFDLFRQFEQPTINEEGRVFFEASAQEDGLWEAFNGEIRTILREGMTAPGTDGAIFEGPRNNTEIVVNDEGLHLICTELREDVGDADFFNARGLWTYEDGELELLVRAESPVPGSQDTLYGGFAFPSINDRGDISFFAALMRDEKLGIDSENDESIWVYTDRGRKAVFREGSTAPAASGGTFSTSDPFAFAIDEDGQLMVRSAFRLPDGIFNEVLFSDAIWYAPEDAYRLASSEFRIFPRLDALNEENLQAEYLFPPGDNPTFASNGDVLFSATRFESDRLEPFTTPIGSGLWAARGRDVQPLIMQGQIAPGTGGESFRFYSQPTVNDRGDAVIYAQLDTDSENVTDANRDGLWYAPRDGELRLIAREGDRAPGQSGFFTGLGERLLINNIGDVVFVCRTTTDSFRQIWTHNVFTGDTARMYPLPGRSDHPEINAGSRRGAPTFAVHWNPHSAGGARRAINDRGELVVTLPLANDGRGIYILEIPRSFPGATAHCLGDCDRDGRVTFHDLVLLLQRVGRKVGDTRCDPDGSGVIDLDDAIATIFRFGKCPAE